MTGAKKKALLTLLLFFLGLYAAFLLIPAAVYALSLPSSKEEDPAPSQSQGESSEPPGFLDGLNVPSASQETSAKSPAEKKEFTVYDEASGKTLSLTAEEFLPGALACEMDLSAPEEALKAQAVAIYTLYTYKKENEAPVHGADFACNSEKWQIYTTPEQMEARWGEDFEAYCSQLQNVWTEVKGQKLLWQGKPICAAYCAISPGNTEAAEHIWSEDAQDCFPYLSAVSSPGDMLADGYMTTAAFTEEAFQTAAMAFFKEDPPDLSGPAEEWLKIVEQTPSGTVACAQLGGKQVTGVELRSAFSLRSACFTVDHQEGTFTFTVRGWGHGVGMSQAGAMFLAKRGETYAAILSHYYPGTELSLPD